LLEPRYGNRRIELAQLVTHPDYQRRGLARELLKRGQQMASGGNFAVGVFASPVGRIVYEKFGFKVLGIAVVRAEGETETLELPVLGWEPAKFR
jgi:GNAT superfamily N-acetyltransferase